jgi:hypothetical protein
MSISFNNLGNYGYLGNQMFQYAALKSFANELNTNYIIPKTNVGKFSQQLTNAFVLNDNVEYGITDFQQVEEKEFNYDESFLKLIQNNVDIKGYFQSEKYFKNIEKDLRDDFEFKQMYSIPKKPYVSIHIRRGDYLSLPNHHPTCSLEYYKKAMEMLTGNHFVIVSDDIEWCKQQTTFVGCEFWQGTSNVHDLYVMTKAKHNIIANSSFSWWGAWLNKNYDKIVIAPKKWFGEEIHHNIDDLLPLEWIVL